MEIFLAPELCGQCDDSHWRLLGGLEKKALTDQSWLFYFALSERGVLLAAISGHGVFETCMIVARGGQFKLQLVWLVASTARLAGAVSILPPQPSLIRPVHTSSLPARRCLPQLRVTAGQVTGWHRGQLSDSPYGWGAECWHYWGGNVSVREVFLWCGSQPRKLSGY
jgi:hypothetical protein